MIGEKASDLIKADWPDNKGEESADKSDSPILTEAPAMSKLKKTKSSVKKAKIWIERVESSSVKGHGPLYFFAHQHRVII